MKGREIALDTSVLIDHFIEEPPIAGRLGEFDRLWIPIPVVAEMEFGIQKLKKSTPGKEEFEAFLAKKAVELIDCTKAVAEVFARIKVGLEKQGSLIPVNDMWIAACCLAANKPLATMDAHFQRVSGLTVEVWRSSFSP